MSTDIVVEKQYTAHRHVVRRGVETLWWGVLVAQKKVSAHVVLNTFPALFVFAKDKSEAQKKILQAGGQCYGHTHCDFEMRESIKGQPGPYEVELSVVS